MENNQRIIFGTPCYTAYCEKCDELNKLPWNEQRAFFNSNVIPLETAMFAKEMDNRRVNDTFSSVIESASDADPETENTEDFELLISELIKLGAEDRANEVYTALHEDRNW